MRAAPTTFKFSWHPYDPSLEYFKKAEIRQAFEEYLNGGSDIFVAWGAGPRETDVFGFFRKNAPPLQPDPDLVMFTDGIVAQLWEQFPDGKYYFQPGEGPVSPPPQRKGHA